MSLSLRLISSKIKLQQDDRNVAFRIMLFRMVSHEIFDKSLERCKD